MRTLVWIGLGTLCASFAIAFGCGGSSTSDDSSAAGDAGDGGNDSSIPNNQACADLAKARCAEIDKCGGGHGVLVRYGDETTCESRLTAQCVTNLAAPNTGASSSTVEACAQSILTEDCASFLGNDQPDPCVPPAGSVANGAACGVSAQCQSTYCWVSTGSACGTCATAPVAGSSCAASRECGGRGGLICVRATTTCVIAAAQSAPCDDTQPCAAGLDCVRTIAPDAGADAGAPSNGICQPAGASVGAACRAGSVNEPACDKALYLTCERKTRQCAADLFAAPGAACGESDAGTTDCTSGSLCAPPGDKTGTCLATAAEGAACDTTNGPTCLAPARCIGTSVDGGVTGTCTLADPSTCR